MRWSGVRLDLPLDCGGGFFIGGGCLRRCCGSWLNGDAGLRVAGGIVRRCGNRRGGRGTRRGDVGIRSEVRSKRRDVVGNVIGDVSGAVIGDNESGFWSAGSFYRRGGGCLRRGCGTGLHGDARLGVAGGIVLCWGNRRWRNRHGTRGWSFGIRSEVRSKRRRVVIGNSIGDVIGDIIGDVIG